MEIFRKKYHQPGTEPGTIDQISSKTVAIEKRPLKIDIVTYSPNHIDSIMNCSFDQCLEKLNEDDITWVHVSGNIESNILKQLGQLLNLHPLALEDVMNHGQRSKIESYDNQIFVI
jgi:magnesium transporter